MSAKGTTLDYRYYDRISCGDSTNGSLPKIFTGKNMWLLGTGKY